MKPLSDFPAHSTYVYLASPYSRHSGGIEMAAKAASRAAGALLRAGIQVYSPIAHDHAVAMSSLIDPLDHAFWLRHCRAMFYPAEAVIVAMLEGWRESHGVNEELRWAREQGKPVYWLEPRSLMWWDREP